MNQNSRGVLLNFRLKRLKVRPSKFKTTAQPTQKPQITTDLTYTVTVFENRHKKCYKKICKSREEITFSVKKKDAMLRGYRRVSRAAAKMFKTVISMWSARISKNTEYSLMLNKKKCRAPGGKCHESSHDQNTPYFCKFPYIVPFSFFRFLLKI